MPYESKEQRKAYFQRRRLQKLKLSQPVHRITVNNVRMVLKRTEEKCPKCKRRFYQVATPIKRLQGKMSVCMNCAPDDLKLYAEVLKEARTLERHAKVKPHLEQIDDKVYRMESDEKCLTATLVKTEEAEAKNPVVAELSKTLGLSEEEIAKRLHDKEHPHINLSPMEIEKIEKNTSYGKLNLNWDESE